MKRLIIIVGLLLFAATAHAQMVITPTTAVFTPSTDDAMVSGYRIVKRQIGPGTVTLLLDIGKPAPDPQTGDIAVDISAAVALLPVGVYYEAIVQMLNPLGVVIGGNSPPSNAFTNGGGPGPPTPPLSGPPTRVVITGDDSG